MSGWSAFRTFQLETSGMPVNHQEHYSITPTCRYRLRLFSQQSRSWIDRVESFMQLTLTQNDSGRCAWDRSHLGRDREITWPSQEIFSARDETLCP